MKIKYCFNPNIFLILSLLFFTDKVSTADTEGNQYNSRITLTSNFYKLSGSFDHTVNLDNGSWETNHSFELIIPEKYCLNTIPTKNKIKIPSEEVILRIATTERALRDNAFPSKNISLQKNNSQFNIRIKKFSGATEAIFSIPNKLTTQTPEQTPDIRYKLRILEMNIPKTPIFFSTEIDPSNLILEEENNQSQTTKPIEKKEFAKVFKNSDGKIVVKLTKGLTINFDASPDAIVIAEFQRNKAMLARAIDNYFQTKPTTKKKFNHYYEDTILKTANKIKSKYASELSEQAEITIRKIINEMNDMVRSAFPSKPILEKDLMAIKKINSLITKKFTEIKKSVEGWIKEIENLKNYKALNEAYASYQKILDIKFEELEEELEKLKKEHKSNATSTQENKIATLKNKLSEEISAAVKTQFKKLREKSFLKTKEDEETTSRKSISDEYNKSTNGFQLVSHTQTLVLSSSKILNDMAEDSSKISDENFTILTKTINMIKDNFDRLDRPPQQQMVRGLRKEMRNKLINFISSLANNSQQTEQFNKYFSQSLKLLKLIKGPLDDYSLQLSENIVTNGIKYAKTNNKLNHLLNIKNFIAWERETYILTGNQNPKYQELISQLDAAIDDLKTEQQSAVFKNETSERSTTVESQNSAWEQIKNIFTKDKSAITKQESLKQQEALKKQQEEQRKNQQDLIATQKNYQREAADFSGQQNQAPTNNSTGSQSTLSPGYQPQPSHSGAFNQENSNLLINRLQKKKK